MINLEQVLMSIITYAVPTASMVMIGWLIRAIKSNRKRQDALEAGVKCLLREQIINSHRYHVINGHEVSPDEYNSGRDMIDCYCILQGKNGYMERIAQEYKDAPISGQH